MKLHLNSFNNKLVLQKVQKAWWLKAITSIELSLISNMGVAWCGSLYPVLYSKHGGSLKWLPDSFTINLIDNCTCKFLAVVIPCWIYSGGNTLHISWTELLLRRRFADFPWWGRWIERDWALGRPSIYTPVMVAGLSETITHHYV